MVRFFRILFGILAFTLFLALWCLRIVFFDDGHGHGRRDRRDHH